VRSALIEALQAVQYLQGDWAYDPEQTAAKDALQRIQMTSIWSEIVHAKETTERMLDAFPPF